MFQIKNCLIILYFKLFLTSFSSSAPLFMRTTLKPNDKMIHDVKLYKWEISLLFKKLFVFFFTLAQQNDLITNSNRSFVIKFLQAQIFKEF
jgi:hypothetical protein